MIARFANAPFITQNREDESGAAVASAAPKRRAFWRYFRLKITAAPPQKILGGVCPYEAVKIQGRHRAPDLAAKRGAARILGHRSDGAREPLNFFYTDATSAGHAGVVRGRYSTFGRPAAAMNDYNHPRSGPEADNHAATAPREAGPVGPRRKRCAQCGKPFGLVRRRRAGMQFCSNACLTEQAQGAHRAVREKARWFEFLNARG
ncbi:MAG: hypothetical protein GC182_16470 [Rhodopseudomonas sp.]|nr:hypothetical protein [Rhodopseudomonas sp.]